MTMTSGPEGDFTEPEEMIELDKRIKKFRKWLKESYVGQTNYENWMGKLKAEILWLKTNPPFEHFHKDTEVNDALKERDGLIWCAALDTLLLYLEDKK